MQEYDEDVSHFEDRFAGDKGVFAKFYIHPRLNEDKSAKEGRPIYEEKEYVEIFTPGSQFNIIRRPASDMDKARFRGAYRAFKEMGSEAVDGTPLSEMSWLGRSQIEELFHSRIRTVEQLAEVNDSACGQVPGLYSLREKAKAYLEKAVQNKDVTALQRRNEELEANMAALQNTVAEQTKALEKLTKALEKADKG